MKTEEIGVKKACSALPWDSLLCMGAALTFSRIVLSVDQMQCNILPFIRDTFYYTPSTIVDI
jgi:hypothetical protein